MSLPVLTWWRWPTAESEAQCIVKRKRSRAKATTKAAKRERLDEARRQREAADRAARLRLIKATEER